MGVVIDLHEVSKYKSWESWQLVHKYNRFKKLGMTRAAHPILVEMHYRAFRVSQHNQPNAS